MSEDVEKNEVQHEEMCC